jgi:hypothetical protein
MKIIWAAGLLLWLLFAFAVDDADSATANLSVTIEPPQSQGSGLCGSPPPAAAAAGMTTMACAATRA